MDYIWFDDQSPILSQVPGHFHSAAIVLHPFVQMPMGWELSKRQNAFEHVYPSNEEILMSGSPVTWQEMMSDTRLRTYHELELALKTSISALKVEYARIDLADKLNANWKADRYYPNDDSISVFLIDDILEVLRANGANKLHYSDPIYDRSGSLDIHKEHWRSRHVWRTSQYGNFKNGWINERIGSHLTIVPLRSAW